MNLYVAGGAICILRVLIMLGASRFDGANVMGHAMAGQAQLINGGVPQQSRVSRSVRRMTGRATFSFHRRMFVSKRSLLIHVTLKARRISASCQSGLLKLKTAVRVMAVTTAHSAFVNLVMEGHRKGRLDLAMTTETKLGVAGLQHSDCGKTRLLPIDRTHKHVRAGKVFCEGRSQMW